MFRVVSASLIVLTASSVCAGEVRPADAVGLAPRGIVRAAEQATLAIDFAAPVRKIHYREGQSFKANARIIEFDCRKQTAEMEAAAAQHREAELVLENNLYLRKRGAMGGHDVAVAETRVRKAAAEAEALRLRLEQCNIDAPFDGSVVELKVFEHETPAPGTPFLKIIGVQSLEIELIVPSHWLVWLKPGEEFRFDVEETAKSYPAKVMRISKAVDPVSQTVKIYAELGRASEVLAGMSGTATFARVAAARE